MQSKSRFGRQPEMRALVFQHLSIEHPGIFRDFMRQKGWHWDAVELDAGEKIPRSAFDRNGTYDLLIVMGGPMDVWHVQRFPWLHEEKAAIRQWVKNLAKPFVGICLGHQLLADALGGEVGLMARPEVGVATVTLTEAGRIDPFFRGIPERIHCLQWHSAEIKRLPAGATVLAQNGDCGTQAIRVGRYAYGLQYHVEVTRDTTTEWAAVPEYATALRRTIGETALPGFIREVEVHLTEFESVAMAMFDNLTRLMQT